MSFVFLQKKITPAVFFRKLRLWIGKLILDKKNLFFDLPIDIGKVRKIIFVSYEAKIGDYIVRSFIFREIKKQAPEIQIHIVVQEKIAELCRHNLWIDEVIVIKNKNFDTLFHASKELAKQQYDLLINCALHLHNRDLLFIRGVKAKMNFGYHKKNYRLFSDSLPYLPKTHNRIIFQKMLEKIGFLNINDHYDVPRNSEAEKKAILFLEKYNQPLISINLFGDISRRQINFSTSLTLLKLVLEIFPQHILLVLTSPQTAIFVSDLLAKISSARVISFLETSRIEENIALIDRSQLLISPDTSLVHIAEGLQKPLLAFYSGDEANYAQWHPSGWGSKVILYAKDINLLSIGKIQSALIDLKAMITQK